MYSPENPVVIHDFEPFNVEVATIDVEGCYGDMTGEILIEAHGGYGSLSYSIDGGETWSFSQNHYTDLPAGDYVVMVKDTLGCNYQYPDTVTIEQPEELSLQAISFIETVGCFGHNDGVIQVYAQGGTGNYRYSIDGGQNFILNNGVFKSLTAGVYNVCVVDENGCIADYANNPIVIEEANPIGLNVNYQNVSQCNDNNNASIAISASGGVGGFQFSIDGGISWQDHSVFEQLEAGTYEVVVMDQLGCVGFYDENPVVITAPEPMEYQSVVKFNITCYQANNGRIAIYSEDAVAYSIDGGITFQEDYLFAGLAPGEYHVVVKNENDCYSYYDHLIEINEPHEMHIESVQKDDIGCDGVLGKIVVYADKGGPNMRYSIDGGLTYQLSNVFEDLEEGEYLIQVANGNSCLFEYEQNPVIIGDQNVFDIAFEVNNGNYACVNTAVNLKAIAENGDQYFWSNGGEGEQITIVHDTIGEVQYICQVITDEGCSNFDTISVAFKPQPEVSITFENEQPAYCMDEEVIVKAQSEDGLYYEWNNGSFDAESQIISYQEGVFDYYVNVENEYGCLAQDIISVEFKDCGYGDKEINANLFPNPSSGKFTIELVGAEDNIEFLVYDDRGRSVVRKMIENNEASIIAVNFDLEEHGSGIYMILIRQGGKQAVERVMVD